MWCGIALYHNWHSQTHAIGWMVIVGRRIFIQEFSTNRIVLSAVDGILWFDISGFWLRCWFFVCFLQQWDRSRVRSQPWDDLVLIGSSLPTLSSFGSESPKQTPLHSISNRISSSIDQLVEWSGISYWHETLLVTFKTVLDSIVNSQVCGRLIFHRADVVKQQLLPSWIPESTRKQNPAHQTTVKYHSFAVLRSKHQKTKTSPNRVV